VFKKYMAFVAAGSLLMTSLLVSQSAAIGTMHRAAQGSPPNAHILGPLHVTSRVGLPISASTTITTVEAPNGAVFMARQSTATPVPSVVWVVDGTSSPSVAEHVPTGVSAMAADTNDLYVANYKRLTAYSRQTGQQVREWTLPTFSTANTSDADLVSVSAYRGTALVMLPKGKFEAVYQVEVASPAAPLLVAQGSSMVFGPKGSLFIERRDNRLEERTSSGKVLVGPKLLDTPTPLGGGVQFVDAVAGGVVWVSEPAGQGLDTSFAMYDESTLKLVATSHQGLVNEQIVNSTSGPLVLGFGDSPVECPQTSKLSNACVYRISSKAVLSDATPVGSAFALLGPQPTVFTTIGTSSQLFLERLAS
jgi:hypothetical protein